MKTLFHFSKFFILAVVFFSSCSNATISTGDEKNKEKIVGNGKVVTETRQMEHFSAISLEGVFNVYLEQGAKEQVIVETDENIIPVILTSIENDTLKVRMRDSTTISKMTKLNVIITLVDLKNLKTLGVGALKSNSVLHLKKLDFNCEGLGATDLKLDAEELNIHSEIVGELKLMGVVHQVKIDHSGIGIIKAFDLLTEKMELKTDGVGAAEVFASEELTIHAHGIGGVQYRGNPKKKNIKMEGVGKVVCGDCE